MGSKTPVPPLGLITVAALLPKNWTLRLADLNTRDLTQDDWEWADTILVSAMFIQKKGLLDVIHKAKALSKTVIVGGPHPTALPDELLEAGADYVVRGEGENTVPSLLEAMGEGRKGVIEHPERPDMIDSPVPRFDLLNLSDYISVTIQTSRGCPFNCEFCDVINLFGRRPRFKSPDQVIAELEALYALGARGYMFICDDNFIGNKKHALELLDVLIPWSKGHGEPFTFTTQVSINLGQDLEMIDLMTEANFSDVFIGIESPDENVLQTSGKLQNIKNPLLESVENIKRNGMTVMGSFIIGLDGEEKGAGERIATFVERSDMPAAMLGVLNAPPNTALWKRLEKEGRLRDLSDNDGGTFTTLNYEPLRPEREIMEEYARTWEYLYEPSHYLERAYRYYLDMRPTRSALAKAGGERPPDEGIQADCTTPRSRFYEISALIIFVWWQGIRSKHRRQFWKQLAGMWKRNPTRLRRYLSACATGEDLFDMRKTVRRNVAEILAQLDPDQETD
jgi:radical SAM superfamily enzyme YgiQ (UPF0313 family)